VNARIHHRSPLTASEVDAHLTIIETIEDVQANVISHHTLLQRVWRPLETFAPRCNCGHVLRFSPWLDGLRVVKCERCEWKTLESPL
jgi:hypothetical protein